jgi:hypothetical protein
MNAAERMAASVRQRLKNSSGGTDYQTRPKVSRGKNRAIGLPSRDADENSAPSRCGVW